MKFKKNENLSFMRTESQKIRVKFYLLEIIFPSDSQVDD